MLFGRQVSAADVKAHCGSTEQIARITSAELSDGKERGVRCLDFFVGGGLHFTVVPDRAMDIAFADFRGINLTYLSSTSITAPSFYEPEGWGWIRGFFGGLLTTCGLLNVGVPDSYNDQPIGAHGRISHTPATNVSHDVFWVGEDLYLVARGEVREILPGKYNLVMRRSIKAIAGQKSIWIHDRITNEGYEKVPHQILYHINLGFPMVNRTSHLLIPSKIITPRDEVANEDKEHFRSCIDPTPDFRERVYYHSIPPSTDGRGWAALVNPDLAGGIGVYVKYSLETLPVLVQWKMMGRGMYVMGLEPANSYGIGMSRQNSLGLLKAIEPQQTIEYQVEIGILEGSDDIDNFEREISVIAPVTPEFASILV